MPELILVKHSAPEIAPNLPANEWHLSETGRLRCKALAQRLAAHRPDVIVSSIEPKAVETAQIVAGLLGKPFETVADLHEHDRRNAGFLSAEQFEAAVNSFFEQPQRLVLGNETADQAHRRFAQTIASVIQKHSSYNVTVVAHGTVITLFVARAIGLEPFPFWKRLNLPSFVVLSLPELGLLTVVENVEAESA